MPLDLEKDVLITHQLEIRQTRPPDLSEERRGFRQIASRMSDGPEHVLQVVCDNALKICNAGSSGVSMLRTINGEEGFSWDALAGQAAPYLGGRAPRQHSPCGVTLQRGTPQLFSHPERYFEWMQSANLSIAEGLVIPLYKRFREPYGTIWIMSHDPAKRFDREDVRIMTELGGYATTALRLIGVFEDWPDASVPT